FHPSRTPCRSSGHRSVERMLAVPRRVHLPHGKHFRRHAGCRLESPGVDAPGVRTLRATQAIALHGCANRALSRYAGIDVEAGPASRSRTGFAAVSARGREAESRSPARGAPQIPAHAPQPGHDLLATRPLPACLALSSGQPAATAHLQVPAVLAQAPVAVHPAQAWNSSDVAPLRW